MSFKNPDRLKKKKPIVKKSFPKPLADAEKTKTSEPKKHSK